MWSPDFAVELGDVGLINTRAYSILMPLIYCPHFSAGYGKFVLLFNVTDLPEELRGVDGELPTLDLGTIPQGRDPAWLSKGPYHS